ncbi:MAG: enoyl-CoA hydratase/isomerase family protein [Pseudomonadales bacterium]|nr:enoyl-CoA hydratase/isomerase family protein [Pseudomonadales bacterium]
MTDKILTEEIQATNGKRIGVITLNDPRTINALSLEMIRAIYPCLLSWQQDQDLVAVFLHSSSERGLCSGGNIRQLYDSMISDDAVTPNPMALEFFSEEYQLDQLIHNYEKPIIVWGHGIVMGGGVGLMVGASHRIVTPESTLAMPEIGIGLFPDVGGSWFLNRMPEGCGLFVGLTGARMQGTDALFSGLADYMLAHGDKARILKELEDSPWQSDFATNHKIIANILNNADIGTTLAPGNLQIHLTQIQQLTHGSSLVKIADKLLQSRSETKNNADKNWWHSAIDALENGCPATAHLVYQQLQRGREKTLAEIFEMELNMVMQCVAHPDFREGVRALLVDKDKNPNWQHSSIADVPDEWIDEHFEPFDTTQNLS